jgi:WD40-like Beta Propeller Repeat
VVPRRLSIVLVLLSLTIVVPSHAQSTREVLLSTDNGYNPIPSPDGSMIAYVRADWRDSFSIDSFRPGYMAPQVMVMRANGAPITASPLADMYLAGWSPDGTELICFRDPKYALVSLKGKFSLRGRLPDSPIVQTSPGVFESLEEPERAFYLPSLRSFGWSRPDGHFDTWTSDTIIETKNGRIAWHAGALGEDVVPSPDGRYLAVFDEEWDKDLWVYDTQSSAWSDLGPVTIYPDYEWRYMKGSWNPWFADSSRLVYLSGSDLVVSNPYGNVEWRFPIQDHAGVPTPSPDGKSVAYLTLPPRPQGSLSPSPVREGAAIWILPLAQGASSFAVTRKTPERILDLKWLGNKALVFDRIDNEMFPLHARIWMVSGIAPAQD